MVGGRNAVPTWGSVLVGSEYHYGFWVVQSRNTIPTYRGGVVGIGNRQLDIGDLPSSGGLV